MGNAQRYRAKPETVEVSTGYITSSSQFSCSFSCLVYLNPFQVVAGVDCDRSIRLLKAFYDKQNPFAPDDKRKVKKAKIEEKSEEKEKEEK